MNIKCTFTSVWSDGSEIVTPSTYNPETKEVSAKAIDANPDGSLEREYITLPDGTELKVCTECHEYVLKVSMDEGVGKQLEENMVCPNPDCKE
jgi:hypothetical protein